MKISISEKRYNTLHRYVSKLTADERQFLLSIVLEQTLKDDADAEGYTLSDVNIESIVEDVHETISNIIINYI